MPYTMLKAPGFGPGVPAIPVRLTEPEGLFVWQDEAIERWIVGDASGPHRGTLEIFTGGGKTRIAMAAFAKVSAAQPETKLAVVVPSEALARQWVASLLQHTSLTRADVGMLGAGRRDGFGGKRALVAVLNSAARHLPSLALDAQPLMLIVDECHRAGAATFSKVLATPAKFRMGLSATPERDEVDDDGLALPFDLQVVGQKLGSIVYSFGLKQARESAWLPDYTVHHHGVRLTVEERGEYDRISRKVTDAADQLTSAGFQTSQAWRLAGRAGAAGPLAQGYVGALAARKDFLYRVSERGRIAARLVEQAVHREAPPRMLLFHERVAEAEALHADLEKRLPNTLIALEHSGLPAQARRTALESFRSGAVNVLVSVKSLVEGIDVPDADVGVSVASSSSVRQRIQTLGRVLRRRFDGVTKQAEMHVLYAHDTVDESIYGKEDWSDLTGSDANRYWLWPLDPDLPPEVQAGPPQTPRPSEGAEWLRFGEQLPDPPAIWLGELPNQEFSVDTRGNVTTREGAWVENPQHVAELVARVRGRPGGRFRVTPEFRLVIVFGESGKGMAPFLVGRLLEPLRVQVRDAQTSESFDAAALSAGSPYPGPVDRTQGSYKLSQRRGGVIECQTGRVTQFAIVDMNQDDRSDNGRRLLQAWQSLNTSGLTFHVNSLGHAWYREGGVTRYLADVPGGFRWPGDTAQQNGTASEAK